MTPKKQKTILIVEDDSLTAMSEKLVLEAYGFSVIISTSGEDALKKVETLPGIDLILMDINLGREMDGTEAAEKILKTYELPIIFLSSHTERDIVEKTEGISGYGYILKDTGETVLIASIKMAFRLFEAKMKEREKEKILQIERNRFNQMSDTVPGVLCTLCSMPDGSIQMTYASSQAEDILGIKKGDIIRDTMKLFSLVHADDIKSIKKKVEISRHNMTPLRCECRYRHPKKKQIWIEGHFRPVANSEKCITWHGFVTDITERKMAQDELEKSKKNYKALIDGMIETAWVIDFKGVVIDVNKQAVKKLGYSKEEILNIGLPGIDSSLTDKDIQDLVKSMPDDKIQIFQTSHKTKEGKEFPVEIHSSLITYQGQQAILSIAHDITERKHMENEIMHQLAEKEALLKAVHHRIKNNIASVESLLSMQARSISSPEAQSALNEAIGRVNCIRILYDTLLQTQDYKDLSVKDYCNSIIDSLIDLFPEKSSIKISRVINDFTIDEKRLFPLGVIIEELFTNIMKYAFPDDRDGVITIQLTKEKNDIMLQVQDNGVGLPEDFDMENHTGFGLMIVKMLSYQLKGTFLIMNDAGTKCVLQFNL